VEEVSPGKEIIVSSLNKKATVLNLDPKKDEVEVQVGAVRLTVPLNDLRPFHKPSAASKEQTVSSFTLTKKDAFSPDLDLRGCTLEEAVAKVDKHLDDALLVGMSHIYLIHGKGTGRLRRGLHDYLDGHRAVSSFRLGREGEGDSGVTVVTLT